MRRNWRKLLPVIDDPESSNILKLVPSHKRRKVTKENSGTTLKKLKPQEMFIIFAKVALWGNNIERQKRIRYG